MTCATHSLYQRRRTPSVLGIGCRKMRCQVPRVHARGHEGIHKRVHTAARVQDAAPKHFLRSLNTGRHRGWEERRKRQTAERGMRNATSRVRQRQRVLDDGRKWRA